MAKAVSRKRPMVSSVDSKRQCFVKATDRGRSLHRAGQSAISMLALCWCMSPLAGESPTVASIEAITLEHGCFGCADESILALRRDGEATLTMPGNARMGRAGRALHGRIARADFDRLAALVVAQGFASMQERYEDPALRDGAWTVTTVRRGGRDQLVFTREGAGPEALKALQSAVEETGRAINFLP